MSSLCDGQQDCFHNPAMHDEVFPYCEQKCDCSGNGACLFDGSKPQCYCNSGYSGPTCDQLDNNECLEHPCHLMAQCQNTLGSYECHCMNGYQGDGHNCTDIDECSDKKCPDNSQCINLPGTYYCNCTQGFTPKGNQGSGIDKCVDVNECETSAHDCKDSEICENTIGSFKCVTKCSPGYELVDGKCIDIDECASTTTNNCDIRAECINTIGGYQCECDDGFEGDGKNCQPKSSCSKNAAICDRHASCLPKLELCVCSSGYTGDGITCHDINECDAMENPCGTSTDKKCVNLDGGFVCCAANQKDDECVKEQGAYCSGGCGANAICANQTCQCIGGFHGDATKKCQDINECEMDEHKCQGVGDRCVNLFGGYQCCAPDSQIPECSDAQFSSDSSTISDILEGSISTSSGGSITVTRGLIPKNVEVTTIGLLACTSYCPANSECVGGYCRCVEGYGGNPLIGCEDVDECATEMCNSEENEWCVNLVGSFVCCNPRNATHDDCLGLEITKEKGLQVIGGNEEDTVVATNSNSSSDQLVTQLVQQSRNFSSGQIILTRGKVGTNEPLTQDELFGLEISGDSLTSTVLPVTVGAKWTEEEDEEDDDLMEEGSGNWNTQLNGTGITKSPSDTTGTIRVRITTLGEKEETTTVVTTIEGSGVEGSGAAEGSAGSSGISKSESGSSGSSSSGASGSSEASESGATSSGSSGSSASASASSGGSGSNGSSSSGASETGETPSGASGSSKAETGASGASESGSSGSSSSGSSGASKSESGAAEGSESGSSEASGSGSSGSSSSGASGSSKSESGSSGASESGASSSGSSGAAESGSSGSSSSGSIKSGAGSSETPSTKSESKKPTDTIDEDGSGDSSENAGIHKPSSESAVSSGSTSQVGKASGEFESGSQGHFERGSKVVVNGGDGSEEGGEGGKGTATGPSGTDKTGAPGSTGSDGSSGPSGNGKGTGSGPDGSSETDKTTRPGSTGANGTGKGTGTGPDGSSESTKPTESGEAKPVIPTDELEGSGFIETGSGGKNTTLDGGTKLVKVHPEDTGSQEQVGLEISAGPGRPKDTSDEIGLEISWNSKTTTESPETTVDSDKIGLEISGKEFTRKPNVEGSGTGDEDITATTRDVAKSTKTPSIEIDGGDGGETEGVDGRLTTTTLKPEAAATVPEVTEESGTTTEVEGSGVTSEATTPGSEVTEGSGESTTAAEVTKAPEATTPEGTTPTEASKAPEASTEPSKPTVSTPEGSPGSGSPEATSEGTTPSGTTLEGEKPDETTIESSGEEGTTEGTPESGTTAEGTTAVPTTEESGKPDETTLEATTASTATSDATIASSTTSESEKPTEPTSESSKAPETSTELSGSATEATTAAGTSEATTPSEKPTESTSEGTTAEPTTLEGSTVSPTTGDAGASSEATSEASTVSPTTPEAGSTSEATTVSPTTLEAAKSSEATSEATTATPSTPEAGSTSEATTVSPTTLEAGASSSEATTAAPSTSESGAPSQTISEATTVSPTTSEAGVSSEATPAPESSSRSTVDARPTATTPNFSEITVTPDSSNSSGSPSESPEAATIVPKQNREDKETFSLPTTTVISIITNQTEKCTSSDQCGMDAICERRTGVCRCEPGFTGTPPKGKCDDVDECATGDHKCHESARCQNFIGGYACFCATGFRKTDDGSCEDINECEEHNSTCCGENASCHNKPGTYSCECNQGYLGDGYKCTPNNKTPCDTTQLTKSNCANNMACMVDNNNVVDCQVCKMGYIKNNATGQCVDINECDTMCQDTGARCENLPGSFKCSCAPGYRGDGFMCTDINECDETHPCHPHADCTNKPGSYGCSCHQGFEGDGVKCVNTAEKSCMDLEKFCGRTEHVSCLSVRIYNGSLSSICECEPGYRLKDNQCVDIDECEENRHNCDPATAICINTPGSYKCECAEGYEGVGGVCTDIDECTRGMAGCDSMAMCINRMGSCGCKCMVGYTGDGSHCSKIEEPSSTRCTDEWQRLCELENKQCTVDEEEVPQCGACLAGHQPVNGTCQSVEVSGLCINNNDCNQHAQCIDVQPNSHLCVCPPGFIGDGKNCDDIDECSLNGMCDDENSLCENTMGAYQCVCKEGFKKSENTCVAVALRATTTSPASEATTEDTLTTPTAKLSRTTLTPTTTRLETEEPEDPEVEVVDKSVGATTEDLVLVASTTTPTPPPTTGVTITSTTTQKRGPPSATPPPSTPSPPSSNGGYGEEVEEETTTTTTTQSPCPKCHQLATCQNGKCECANDLIGDGTTICAKKSEADCTTLPTLCATNARCDLATKSCQCAPGYIGDGYVCQPHPQDCLLRKNLCSPEAICQNRRCQCLPGFTGDGIKCVSIHERASNCTQCDDNAHCVGGTTCKCNAGYFGNGLCCVPDPLDCVLSPGVCHPHATCDSTQRQCKCQSGYSGNGVVCHPQKSCRTDRNVCSKNAICLPTGSCVCRHGFNGDGYTCTNRLQQLMEPATIDATSCLTPCDANTQLCIDGECLCKQGYRANGTVGGTVPTCEDIDECAEKTHNCDARATCQNTDGSHICTCPNGYIGDGTTCVQHVNQGKIAVYCEADGMTLVLGNETATFEGKIFVKGQAENPYCSKSFSSLLNSAKPYVFKVRFEHCDVSLDANHTMASTVIVQKHAMFLTNSADSYDLRCQYPVGNRNVESRVNVSELATVSTLTDQNSQLAPTCKLTISNEKASSISSATVGETLQLSLEVVPNDNFGILPRNCIAMNLETGEKHILTDASGCAIDESLFPQWSMVSGHKMQAVFRTFKWPDSSMMRFQCDCAPCIGPCATPSCLSSSRFRRHQTPILNDDIRQEMVLMSGVESLAVSSIINVHDNHLDADNEQSERISDSEICVKYGPLLIAIASFFICFMVLAHLCIKKPKQVDAQI